MAQQFGDPTGDGASSPFAVGGDSNDDWSRTELSSGVRVADARSSAGAERRVDRP